jgi:AAA ATPase domain
LLPVTALLGRSAELARLRRWLAEAAGGVPQVVVCSGEAGIGKTRLLEALSEEAESGGARVLWARSLAPASAPPYWLWRQLFGPDAVTGAVQVGGRLALFERLADRLIETAAAGGAVVVVDDIHWADEPSLVALLHVVRTLHRAMLLVCVAERSGRPDTWCSRRPHSLSSRPAIVPWIATSSIGAGRRWRCLAQYLYACTIAGRAQMDAAV